VVVITGDLTIYPLKSWLHLSAYDYVLFIKVFPVFNTLMVGIYIPASVGVIIESMITGNHCFTP